MPEDEVVEVAKRSMRVRMRTVRSTIAADAPERARRSRSICAGAAVAIEAAGWRRAGTRVLLFDPRPGEPDPVTLADWCANEAMTTYLPVVDGPWLRIEPGDLDAALLDVVIVPGLAFTLEGHRLGQGGGHFDRFLPQLRPDCLRLGVAFREQLVDEVPTAGHDVSVDRVITD